MQILAATTQRARCPFCKDGLAGEVWTCTGCATTHHSDCWSEHGGCVTLGCTAPKRPRPEQPRGIPAWRRARLAEQAARDRAEAERRRLAAEEEARERAERPTAVAAPTHTPQAAEEPLGEVNAALGWFMIVSGALWTGALGLSMVLKLVVSLFLVGAHLMGPFALASKALGLVFAASVALKVLGDAVRSTIERDPSTT